MDSHKEASNPNPRAKANILSKLLFAYTLPTFYRGYKKNLEAEDLYNPLEKDRSQHLGDRLERKWLAEVEGCKKLHKSPSLMKALVKTFWPEYFLVGILASVIEVVRIIQPIMMGQLLLYFKPGNDTVSKQDALLYAGAVCLAACLTCLFMNQYVMYAFHYGMRVRAACCSTIYRKALRLSKTALGDTASGKIVNLLSNDVSRFDIVSVFIHQMWLAPTSALVVTALLYMEAGFAGLVGVIPVFLVVPLQSYTGKLQARYRLQTAMKTDERVRMMDEIISGVQVIKMYAWEIPFSKLIAIARRAELKVVIKSSYVRGLFMTFNLFTTRMALFCTLLTMALTDREITADKVFVFMMFYSIIAATMSTMFVRGISEVAELFVAIKRLQNFLCYEEFQELDTKPNNNSNINNNEYAICLQNLTAKWSSKSSDIALHNIDLNVSRNQLLGIIGPVGSGKSSMLQTILGELEVVSGSIIANGKISYASQEPWVFGASVRQNILFGLEYNKKRYNEVIRVCSLEKDFKQLSDGDQTIVGDRGSSLSGGQKARINLARACYREADIYLLDDPLSAVDVHVSKQLYDDCINGFLANKSRVLVTHQVHHLRTADHIIILNNGSIENQGTFLNLANSDTVYAKLLKTDPEQEEEILNNLNKQKIIGTPKAQRKMSIRSRTSLSSAMSEVSIADSVLQDENAEDDEGHDDAQNKWIREESSKGKVKGNLFWKYINNARNVCLIFFVTILFLLAQCLASGVDLYVSFWTTVEETRALQNSTNVLTTEETTATSTLWPKEIYLYIYGTLVISVFFVALARSILFYNVANICSQSLHDNMFFKVIKAKMRFFDTNSSGRILNRFSKDIGAIDDMLPKVILDSAQILLSLLGSLIVVAIINTYFLILAFIVGILFFFLRQIFLKSSKNIKRLEGIMRSPVFTHLSASMEGLTTIRAYGAQEILNEEFDKHQDYHTSAWFMYITASSAFGFWMDFICFIFTTFVTFSFLTFGEDLGLSAAKVGLAITQASALTGMVQWGMRQSAEITNQLMSVERVLEYDILPEEKQPVLPKTPPKRWPNRGRLVFKNLGLRYDEDTPLVLKDLNITIQPNEKVGIVGRTGAGKSSLISALFRLANVEGSIEIDDIDTKDLQLQMLRSNISIIPQDPILFSGTLRYNLDPFEEYNDELLYKAINEVELRDPQNIINRLENRVMDRGTNYSVGQRQLICLARAIVRDNKILMLDEATANVDPQTDELIQKTIRHKFEDCTVLTVAHRLNTIMDSDKVLVMDAGTMVEFDHPHILLQNTNGKFYKMVAETGKTMAEQLKKIARESYHKKRSVPEFD